MISTIEIELTQHKKPKPSMDQLGFGVHFTDHMFMMEYSSNAGWCRPRIVPYQPITLSPAAKVFHYGQTIFEGMKAYRAEDGRIHLFRPWKNLERMNRSNLRMSVPPVEESIFVEAVKELVKTDQDWIPGLPGTSLYIRPFIIATEPILGIAPSENYLFMIIMSPVGAYYKNEGFSPVRIHVETHDVRAVTGGVGNAKTAGNYAAGLRAQKAAKENGYSQVLWLDGVHRQFIEEVGSMNVFFKIGGTVYTPELTGSILDGITRDSVIQILKAWSIPVIEKAISINELYEAIKDGSLEEAFGTGTAAVISPIGEINWRGEQLVIHQGRTGMLSRKVYEALTGIQTGALPDPFGWVVPILD
ncbi:branched-chain amino acid aminotransferase [Neobacillus mesonae]|nr:branched-chain amino acid aminotransferase [Neobacillus mesonae]